ncbi:MAG: PLP-dependent transferase, partial [Alphaproteobacteria bacterium]
TPPAGLPRILDGERVSGFVTELPSNPLLRSADLPSLSELARAQDGLVVVDDTAGTPVNVEITPYADLIAVSLTKYMSGRGDVLGGALLVSPRSPHGERLRDRLAREHEELLWWSDAVVLEERSRDFVDRMRRTNKNAEALSERLRAHPRIEQIYYPKFDPGGGYDKVRRRDGGYGGLLSILVRDAPTRAPVVYDNLRVSKGPNLGTAYTLACPYTILAHYGELDWAESCGVSRWLIRVSVGLENIEDLWSRFEDALAAAG